EPIEKPRVRTADGKNEIDLETYSTFSKKDALREEAIVRIGGGISTREISKSAVSRRVIDSTKTSLETFLARRWDKHKFVSIMIDGVHIGNTHVVAAV